MTRPLELTPEPGEEPTDRVEPVRRLKVAQTTTSFLPLADSILANVEQRTPIAWALGAHGGAGASTLAAMIAPLGDAHGTWPVHDDFPYVVVCCRSTRAGLDAAQSAVLQAQAGGAGVCRVLGVVIVADTPGKTPKSLHQRETLLEDITRIWRVPYYPGVREAQVTELAQWRPHTVTETKRVKRAPVTQCVPSDLATIADEIFHAAYRIHTH